MSHVKRNWKLHYFIWLPSNTWYVLPKTLKLWLYEHGVSPASVLILYSPWEFSFASKSQQDIGHGFFFFFFHLFRCWISAYTGACLYNFAVWVLYQTGTYFCEVFALVLSLVGDFSVAVNVYFLETSTYMDKSLNIAMVSSLFPAFFWSCLFLFLFNSVQFINGQSLMNCIHSERLCFFVDWYKWRTISLHQCFMVNWCKWRVNEK